jgi:hypothetical protein
MDLEAVADFWTMLAQAVAQTAVTPLRQPALFAEAGRWPVDEPQPPATSPVPGANVTPISPTQKRGMPHANKRSTLNGSS